MMETAGAMSPVRACFPAMEAAGVAVRRGDPPGAGRRAIWGIGRARRRRGRPPDGNPKGRGLLRHGFVEGLVRSPATAFALLLPTPQNPHGAGASISGKHAQSFIA